MSLKKGKCEKKKSTARLPPYSLRRSVTNESKSISINGMLLKFPHLGAAIFDQLDNESLHTSRHVSRHWSDFITSEKFYNKRIDERIEEVHEHLKCNHFNQSAKSN